MKSLFPIIAFAFATTALVSLTAASLGLFALRSTEWIFAAFAIAGIALTTIYDYAYPRRQHIRAPRSISESRALAA